MAGPDLVQLQAQSQSESLSICVWARSPFASRSLLLNSRSRFSPVGTFRVVGNQETTLALRLREHHSRLSHPEAIARARQRVYLTAKKASTCCLVWPHKS